MTKQDLQNLEDSLMNGESSEEYMDEILNIIDILMDVYMWTETTSEAAAAYQIKKILERQ